MWRIRKAGPKNTSGETIVGGTPSMEVSIPTHFRCPISLELMKDPVTVSTGITYDRQSIETWLDVGNQTCPLTNQVLSDEDLIPNHNIRRMIQDWCVSNQSLGVERIPTPRIPVTALEVSEILSEIGTASGNGDLTRSAELAGKIKALVKVSERNRRLFVSNGAGQLLTASFHVFALQESHSNDHQVVFLEILSALPAMFPLNEESCSFIGSPASLRAIVRVLKCGGLAGRLNAVLVLKEILHSGKEAGILDAVSETEGLVEEALVKLIKEPISPQATKASLMAAFYLVSSNDEKITSRFVELGIVDLLLEILVDTEKSMCERALGVLDGICNSEMGRNKARDHSLTIPVLVKKIFRVSDMGTEFAVSVLWKLGKDYKKKGGGESLVEALQVGAFQKLLLLLQVGCSQGTKEKATDLLKLLRSASRGGLDCIESIDLKGLKRSS